MVLHHEFFQTGLPLEERSLYNNYFYPVTSSKILENLVPDRYNITPQRKTEIGYILTKTSFITQMKCNSIAFYILAVIKYTIY